MLRRRWPDAYIEIAGYPHIAVLAAAGGLADRVVSLDRADVARFFSLRPEIPAEQSQYVRSFDLIISYLFDPGETVRGNLEAAGARQVIYGSPRVETGHAVDHLLRPLEALALYPEGEERPVLRLGAEHLARGRAAAAALGPRPVVLHPGSGGGARKNWPLERFLDLARRIAAAGMGTPALLLGEADDAIAAALARTRHGFPVISGRELLDVAALLAVCAGYAGNDSGITHLAAALGIPAVAVFGPTDPATWGPRGPNVRIARSLEASTEGLAAVPVDAVFAALADVSGRDQ
jgi:ADP-heptose:LPS heptosyltransferase